VAVGDFNGDGKPDLAVTNLCASSSDCTNGSVGVLLGNGDGTFQAAASYGSGGYFAFSVAVADVNGDGKPDLVLANNCSSMGTGCSGSVSVLLGNGDGTFQSAKSYGSAGDYGANSVFAADVNGDGKPDLIVANQCAPSGYCGNGGVGVLLGNGDGTFRSAVSYGCGGAYAALSVAVADVNGDGRPDILVANQYAVNDQATGSVGVLLGNGDGTFQTAVSYGSGDSATSFVTVGDVNADGKPDLVVANWGGSSGGSVGVLLGNGDGTFQTAATFATTGNDGGALALADFNGDETVDVASGYGDALLLGNGDGTLQSPLTLGASGQGIAVGDFNRDGRPDLVVGGFYGDNSVSVLLNISTGFNPATTTTLTSSPNPSGFGQSVTFTATVTAQRGGSPTGTVSFLDGTTSLGTSSLNGSGVATFPTSILTVGTHGVTATYNGDANFDPSTSSVLYQIVQGAAVALSPSNITFPTTVVFTTSTAQTVTLTNTGLGTLTISNIAATGPFVQTNTCGTTVAPGASCTISVRFKPANKGQVTGSVTITDNAPGSPQRVKLSGVGTFIQTNPTSENFGNQPVGTTSIARKVIVSNKGNSTVSISSIAITGTNAGDFAETNRCGSSLASGASCKIVVTFTPSAKGKRTANVAITDNGGGSPQLVALSGTGT
jgi:hypothetical protein